MSDGVAREFRAGVTWSFAPDRLDEVVDAVALLPEELQDHCVYATGTIEFDVEVHARSFEDARRIAVERVVRALSFVDLAGQPEAVSATDDVSYASWRYVDGRFEE
jgi:hypothetical protein